MRLAIPYSRTIIGGLPWYSVLIVTGIALAVYLASKNEKRMGLPADTAVDLALVAVPCGIIGARLYYVAMSWQMFAANPISALYVWQGGLAIYGGVIGGALGVWLYARRKKISFASLADLVAPGLILAQAIGRWGNYFNMEAYGPELTEPALQFFPLAVLIPTGRGYAWHAATFFYESMWCLAGFAFVWKKSKSQQEKGNLFLWYLLIYGAGRFVIEQLRMDSLYLANLRVSQLLSLVLCTAASMVLIFRACRRKGQPFGLCAACCLLWIARWLLAAQHAGYAVLIVCAGALAIWLVREKRRGLLGVTALLVLDFVGLFAALAQWPVSAGAALWLHSLITSITLPLGVLVLCSDKD